MGGGGYTPTHGRYTPLSHRIAPSRFLSRAVPARFLSQISVPKSVPSLSRLGELLNTQKNVHAGVSRGPPRCPGGPPVQTPALRHGVRGVGGVAGGTPRRPGEVVGIPRMAGGYPRSPVSMPVRAGDVTAPGGTPGPPGGGLDGRWRSAPCGCRVGGPTPLVVSLPLPAVRVRSTTCTRVVRTQSRSHDARVDPWCPEFFDPPTPPGLLHRSGGVHSQAGGRSRGRAQGGAGGPREDHPRPWTTRVPLLTQGFVVVALHSPSASSRARVGS